MLCQMNGNAIEEISTKWNKKQLYLLVIHLLERAKKKCKWYVRDALSKISEDMWKRAIICGLKENIQMKNEDTLMNKQNSNNCICKTDNDTDIKLLVFGLMIFNPRIQLIYDDNNINFGALNNNIDSDIGYPCLNNEIEQVFNDENAFNGCYTVVHEAARSEFVWECKRFFFDKTDYNTVINEEKNNNESITSGSANKVKSGNTLN
ncbi:hypothetical protein RFI_34255, partial [Reticulomyxa filosa]